MTKHITPEVGYSVLRVGAVHSQDICIVAPHIGRVTAMVPSISQRRLEINTDAGAVGLPELPADVGLAFECHPNRVLLVTTDCLSMIRCALRADTRASRAAPIGGALDHAPLFNDFLTRAAQVGELTVEHRRVLARQPENEIFVRKALVAMHRLAPAVAVNTTYVELVNGHARHGRASLASAVEQHLKNVAELRIYTGEPRTDQAAAMPSTPALGLFALLHSYAYCELNAANGPATRFGLAAASSGIGLSGQHAEINSAIREAADSVFSQSFSDAYAAILIAAFNGNDAALNVSADVMRRRAAAGDFGTFSLAPLSQDTETALQIARHEMRSGKSFSSMSKHELLGHAAWLASESMGAWLQKHEVGARPAAAVAFATEAATQVIAAAALAAQEARVY